MASRDPNMADHIAKDDGPDSIVPGEVQQKTTFSQKCKHFVKAWTTRCELLGHWIVKCTDLQQRWIDWGLRLCVPFQARPPIHEEGDSSCAFLRP